MTECEAQVSLPSELLEEIAQVLELQVEFDEKCLQAKKALTHHLLEWAKNDIDVLWKLADAYRCDGSDEGKAVACILYDAAFNYGGEEND